MLSGAVIGSTLFAASAIYATSKFAESRVDRKSPEVMRNGKVLMRLLDGECIGMIRSLSVNTITFYSGRVSKEYVSGRVTAIVAANPWLLCRLVKSKELGDICALYPLKFDPSVDSHDCFQCMTDPIISSKLPYEDLLHRLDKALVPKGIDCIGKNVGQFKVTLIEIKPDQEYALVMSMSHTIGDGHTFYSLYRMLDVHSKVKSIVPNRKYEFSATLREVCGAKYHDWLMSPFLTMGIISTLLWRPLPKVSAFSLDQSAVDDVKKSYSASLKPGQYLSTNDVITHWFWQMCRAKYGIMAVNFRSRFPEYKDNMAGNYEALLYFTRKEFETPIGIRESLTTFNKDIPMPTPLETVDFNIPTTTNWTSFYADVHLEGGAVQSMHMPLINTDSCLTRDMCVIFNMSKNTRAVMMFTRTNIDVERLFESRDNVVRVLRDRIV